MLKMRPPGSGVLSSFSHLARPPTGALPPASYTALARPRWTTRVAFGSPPARTTTRRLARGAATVPTPWLVPVATAT